MCLVQIWRRWSSNTLHEDSDMAIDDIAYIAVEVGACRDAWETVDGDDAEDATSSELRRCAIVIVSRRGWRRRWTIIWSCTRMRRRCHRIGDNRACRLYWISSR
jgi:hypothetical protein